MKIQPNSVDVLIGADEPIVRYGIRKLIETDDCLRIAGEAADCPAILKLTNQLKPDILILDFATRQAMSEVLISLSSSQLRPRTIVLVPAAERERMFHAFKLGARGVLLKHSATDLLLASIHAVVGGQYWLAQQAISSIAEIPWDCARHGNTQEPATYRLTPREFEIINTIVAGCSNKDVGRKFSISERTVKHHLSNIYEKLGLSSRLELAIFAINHGFEDKGSQQLHFSAGEALEPKYQQV